MERRMKGGFGVMIDDVFAAFYAYVLFVIFIIFVYRGLGVA
jgi:phosphatidylglycerophosphatase A